jgi:hypothetical protein
MLIPKLIAAAPGVLPIKASKTKLPVPFAKFANFEILLTALVVPFSACLIISSAKHSTSIGPATDFLHLNPADLATFIASGLSLKNCVISLN